MKKHGHVKKCFRIFQTYMKNKHGKIEPVLTVRDFDIDEKSGEILHMSDPIFAIGDTKTQLKRHIQEMRLALKESVVTPDSIYNYIFKENEVSFEEFNKQNEK